jgi:hypothetical protein
VTTARLRAILIVTALMAFGIYALVVRPMEATIGERYADVDAARAQLARDLTFAQRRTILERQHARIRSTLAGLQLRDAPEAIVARFLRRLGQIAAAETVTVQHIAGTLPLAIPRAPAASAEQPTVDEQSLDVAVLGSYGDVLRAVRELNGGDVAMRISISALGNAERLHGRRPQLHAIIHVTLLRAADVQRTHAS